MRFPDHVYNKYEYSLSHYYGKRVTGLQTAQEKKQITHLAEAFLRLPT